MRAALLAWVALLAAGCSQPLDRYVAPPSDAEIIERLRANRSDYEAIRTAMFTEPRIERLSRVPGDKARVLPKDAGPARVQRIMRLMEQEGILYARTHEEGRSISLTLFENNSSRGYQSRTVTIPDRAPHRDRLTEDAGAAALAMSGVAWRDLGDGWYLRAGSALPPGEGPQSSSPGWFATD